MMLFNQKIVKNFGTIFLVLLMLTSFFPYVTHAATIDCPSSASALGPSQTPSNFKEVVCLILGVLNSLVPIIIGLTLLVFLWGLARFILAAGDEKKLEAGKSLMIWGVIGLFVMVSVWGIVNILYGSFFGGSIGLPLLKTTTPQ